MFLPFLVLRGCTLIRHSQGGKGGWGGERQVLNKRTLEEMICYPQGDQKGGGGEFLIKETWEKQLLSLGHNNNDNNGTSCIAVHILL